MEAADLPGGREDNLLQDIQVEVDLQCCILHQDILQPEDQDKAEEEQYTAVEAEVV